MFPRNGLEPCEKMSAKQGRGDFYDVVRDRQMSIGNAAMILAVDDRALRGFRKAGIDKAGEGSRKRSSADDRKQRVCRANNAPSRPPARLDGAE
jgi:hypothetical protein